MVTRDGHFQLFERHGRHLFVHQPHSYSDAINDGFRPWRTAGDIEINRHELFNWPQHGIGVKPDAAAAGAGADGKHEFWGGHGFVSALQCFGGGTHRRALAEHDVGMAG